ncbi:MAG TPA: preprotein translocase subunit SecE [Gaiellaceae bacterium]|nr:preprotein translocase subunit SecE [Gaiellaceae bacterium]
MARSTRQKRRAKRRERKQDGSDQQAGLATRARARQQQVRPAAQAPKPQTGARRVPGGGFRRFVGEAWAELKKVEWPGQSQVIQGTIVVIIACAIVGAYLWLADLGFKPFVRDILLG